MKTLALFVLGLFLSSPLFAQTQDPVCSEFQYIKSTMRAIDAESVDRVIPYADWIERKYRREDRIEAGKTTGKVVILALIGRLNFITFWMIPTRAEAATVTGSYLRNPESYSHFLQLTPQRACAVLRLGGSEGILLRNLTHEVYLEIHRARS